MKVVGVFVLAGLLLIPVFYGVFALGARAGAAKAHRDGMRAIGLTPRSAKLHQETMRLLNRITRHTDLDGDFATDILSDPTRREIDKILADYRKEIDT